MPAYTTKVLSAAELAAIYDYLASLPPPPPPQQLQALLSRSAAAR